MSSPGAAPHPERGWPLSARVTVLLVAACAAVGVAAGLVLRPFPHEATPATASVAGEALPSDAFRADATWPAHTRPAPPFALHDQNGRLVSLAGQRGHKVLLAFMDSRCKLICTYEGPMIAKARRELAPHTALTVLVVSVNPWQDTPASTRQVAARWHLGGDWHWLRGSASQLRPIWNSYGIAVVRTTGDVSHSTAIYLVDGSGYERAGFNWPFTAPAVVRRLRAL
jgi:protein SCO1